MKQIVKKGFGEPKVDHDFISHANDPFVLQKVADAKRAISKINFPDYLKNATTKSSGK